ncbi:MAG: sigma-70 family RNA polymerase sigma factor [Candidatus Cloacimonadota bacterium]|nr:sigma-70 family RNA polymerase sigma factor [Candidatus Cloacimonadota bacterium]
MPKNNRTPQNKNSFLEDLRLAQKICQELLAKNNDAIIEIYQKFQQLFVNFCRKRLYNNDPHQAESVLSNFWIELLNAKAICSYKAQASLKSYLIKILWRRIIDENRSFKRENSKKENIGDDQKIGFLETSSYPSPEKGILNKEQERIMQEALLMLEEASIRDADLIKMYLHGLNYRQMVEQQSTNQKTDDTEMAKKVNSIKKQFTRERTGSLAKFKICLRRCLKKHNWTDCYGIHDF